MTDYSVGDRVRIISSPDGYLPILVGAEGTVMKVDPTDGTQPVLAEFVRGRGGVLPAWPHFSEIELVPSALPAAQAAVEAAQDGDVRSKVLAEASALINGARQEEYGTPQVNFARIAKLWDVLVPREHPWTPAQVALAMAGVKLGRAVQGYKRDTATDLAGYAALWALLSEDEGK